MTQRDDKGHGTPSATANQTQQRPDREDVDKKQLMLGNEALAQGPCGKRLQHRHLIPRHAGI